MHALSDFVILSFGLIAPFAFSYADTGLPALYTFGLVGSGVVLNLLTDYPLGVARFVPLRFHRLIELTGPGVFIALPWWLFPGTAAWVLTAIGAINFATALFTDAE
jgi:hypothetical protein